jgi:threonine dehydrogenase-like Zn-dependent dehydrogenase
LLAQLLHVAGCAPVIGIDVIPLRLEKARESGTGVVIDASREDADAAVKAATFGAGVDLAFDATRNPNTLPLLMQMAALSGKVVIVGSIPGTVEIALYDPLQTKELTIIGAWQPRAPLAGHAYFPWAQWRNRHAFMERVREGAVRVAHLITHRAAPQEASRVYEMISAGADTWLGIVFQW